VLTPPWEQELWYSVLGVTDGYDLLRSYRVAMHPVAAEVMKGVWKREKDIRSSKENAQINCLRTQKLYLLEHAEVTGDAWQHYLRTGRAQGYVWRGEKCKEN
jgi:hypothetical protein